MTRSESPPKELQPFTNVRLYVFFHLVIALSVSVVSFVGFLLVMYGVKDAKRPITATDQDVLSWMHAHQAPGLTTGARLLADLGNPLSIVGIAIAGMVIGYLYRPVRGAAWTLPIAIIGAGVLIETVKETFRRARPDVFTPLLHEKGYSFPSGHSLISIVVYGLLGYFGVHLFSNRAARIAVGVATGLLVVLIGVSRIYVGVHYPSDVLAGWSLGFPWLVGCLALHERLALRYSRFGEPVFPRGEP